MSGQTSSTTPCADDFSEVRVGVRAIASGDLGAIRRVLARTGKLVGIVEAKHEDDLFITRLLAPEDETPESNTRQEIEALIEAVLRGTIRGAEVDRAVERVTRALGAHASDLLFWSRPGLELSARELYEIATTRRGAALAEYLHPSCRSTYLTGASLVAVVPQGPTLTALQAARRALCEMAVAGDIELPVGEAAASTLAIVIDRGVSADAIADWAMGDDNMLGEVFAEDAVLLAHVQQAVARAESG